MDPVVAHLPCTGAPDPFTWSWAPSVIPAGGAGEVTLWLTVPEGGVVYTDSLRVSPVRTGGLSVGSPVVPAGEVRRDEQGVVVDGRHVARGLVGVVVPVRAGADVDGLVSMTFALQHEGCLNGRCWPRSTGWIDVFVDVVPVFDDR